MLGDLTLNLHHSSGLVPGLTCASWNRIGPPSRSFQTCCAPRQCVNGSGRIFNTSNRAQSRSEHLISSLQAWPLESAIFQASRSDLAVSAASHGPADTAFNKMTARSLHQQETPATANVKGRMAWPCAKIFGGGSWLSNRVPAVRLPTHLGSGGQTSPVLPFQRDSGSRLSISSLDLVDPKT